MRHGISIFLMVVAFLCFGCSVDDSFLETNDGFNGMEQIHTKVDSTYYYHNFWTYSMMRHHYYWNTEMPDSTTLDFAEHPTKFFNSLLSSQDRFSWCEVNTDYRPSGYNPGSTVSFDSVYMQSGKKIGYAIYDEFNDSADIRGFAVRMKKSQIDEMVLDLRYNPGGYASTCSDFASLFVPTGYLGELFQIQRYNETLTNEKVSKYGYGEDYVYLKSSEWFQMWGLNLDRLIVLVSERTASASEALIVGLRPYMEVVVIGTKTCGKDVGSYTIADSDYRYQLQPITFKYYNALNESTPEDGIIPDIIVQDDMKVERGDTNEVLLKAALQYIEDNPLN